MVRRRILQPGRTRLAAWALLLAALWFFFSLPGQGRAAPRTAAAPPDSLPDPGSYRLERIMAVPDGTVINSEGKVNRFTAYTTGKITVLSLIYTHCADPNGCPMARELMQGLKKTIETDPRMAHRVQFVSLSFDPRNDTPDIMRAYGGKDATDQRLRWYFLTTSSPKELRPLLDGLSQDVSRVAAAAATARTSVLSHMLKIFLVDTHGDVREIYTTSYIAPKVLLNDIRTLLLEDDRLQ
jgi:protein SCO1/2